MDDYLLSVTQLPTLVCGLLMYWISTKNVRIFSHPLSGTLFRGRQAGMKRDLTFYTR